MAFEKVEIEEINFDPETNSAEVVYNVYDDSGEAQEMRMVVGSKNFKNPSLTDEEKVAIIEDIVESESVLQHKMMMEGVNRHAEKEAKELRIVRMNPSRLKKTDIPTPPNPQG